MTERAPSSLAVAVLGSTRIRAVFDAADDAIVHAIKTQPLAVDWIHVGGQAGADGDAQRRQGRDPTAWFDTAVNCADELFALLLQDPHVGRYWGPTQLQEKALRLVYEAAVLFGADRVPWDLKSGPKLWPTMRSTIEEVAPGRIGGSIELEELPQLKPWLDELRSASVGHAKPGQKSAFDNAEELRKAIAGARGDAAIGLRVSLKTAAARIGIGRETLRQRARALGVDLDAELRGAATPFQCNVGHSGS